MAHTLPSRLVRDLETVFPGCYSAIDGLRKGQNWPRIQDVAALMMENYRLSAASADYYAPALCACAVWNCYKRVYAFTDPLATALCGGEGQALSLDIPVEPLGYLPFPGVYIHAPDRICAEIAGFYAWTQTGASGETFLHLLFLGMDGKLFIPGGICLAAGSLAESLPDPDGILYALLMAAARGVEGALTVMLQKLPVSSPCSNVIHNLTVRAAQLLLYLVSSDPDIDPEQAPKDETVRYHVGRTVSRTLKTDARKSYIRQGHWHNYWYGPKNGERRLIPKWIPPIVVGEQKELSVKLNVKKID